MPAVCVSRSRIVICRRAGTIAAPVSSITRVCANAGMKRDTGSLMAIFPASTSARIATEVIALLCDAMRKIASGVIGRFASLSAQPTAFW